MAVSDTLKVDYQPSTVESTASMPGAIPIWSMALTFFYSLEDTRVDNRTLFPIGVGATTSPDPAAQLLRCVSSHTGSETMRPSVTWLRNGVELVANGSKVTIDTIDDGVSGTASLLTVTDFQLSDTGVYQCVFTNPAGVMQEVITSTPFRLDAGTYIHRPVLPIARALETMYLISCSTQSWNLRNIKIA